MMKSLLIATAAAVVTLVPFDITRAADGHAHHGHDLSGAELGLLFGAVHLEEEDEYAFGVHAHLLYPLGDCPVLGHVSAGPGIEYLFADEEHYALMLTLAVNPWRNLVLAVAPGVQWAEHDGEKEAEYATHVEASYVIPFKDIDIGPVVDYSWTRDESHYMIGIHIGIHL